MRRVDDVNIIPVDDDDESGINKFDMRNIVHGYVCRDAMCYQLRVVIE